MKDLERGNYRPDWEDSDDAQDLQPAYKAFAKDKRPRTAQQHTGDKAAYRPRHDFSDRPGGDTDNATRNTYRKDYGTGYRSHGYNRDNDNDNNNDNDNGYAQNKYRTERRQTYDRNGYGNDRRQYQERRYETEVQPRRRSFNPNFDEFNQPVNRYGNPHHADERHTEKDYAGQYRQYGNKPYGNRYDSRHRESSEYDRQYRPQPRYVERHGERNSDPTSSHEYGNRTEYSRGYATERNDRYGNTQRDRSGYTPRKAQYGGKGDFRNNRKNTNAKYGADRYPSYPAPPIEDKIRLNRYIAMSGICSRREADEFIQSGVVTVNGLTVTELGAKVSQNDEVRFNGNIIKNERKVYIVMNKPKGYVTSVEDPHADKTVMDLLHGCCNERVYPVGRLDKNSLGVLLITNDGDLARKLMHPSYEKKKVYQLTLDKPLTRADMDALVEGFELEDGEIHADEVSYVNEKKNEVGIEIHSGRNRIVRRMFEHLGYKVLKLDRVYFAGLTKQRLKRGAWRFLTQREVQMLCSGQYE